MKIRKSPENGVSLIKGISTWILPIVLLLHTHAPGLVLADEVILT